MLVVGGEKLECEADEVALCCRVGIHNAQQGVWWIRLFGMVRRGSSKIYLRILPDRFAQAAGQ
eukprot:915175-Alexandrium_andersonii.AAC.1